MNQHIIKYGSLVALLVGGFFLMQSQPETEVTLSPYEEVGEHETVSDESEIWMVDIKGAVKNPGVYEVSASMRLVDVVELAGGLQILADEQQLNLAQKVEDEMVIYVPFEGEEGSHLEKDDGLISLNEATHSQLQQLNGIGESKATAIIAYREDVGLFETIDDVMNVSGIGEKTFEGFKDQVKP